MKKHSGKDKDAHKSHHEANKRYGMPHGFCPPDECPPGESYEGALPADSEGANDPMPEEMPEEEG